DIPTATGSTFGPMRESTPEYVPLRSTPPSRAVVIGQKDEKGEWEDQGKPSLSKQPPSIPSAPTIKPANSPGAQAPMGKTTTTPPSPSPRPTPPPIQQKQNQPAEKPQDKITKADKPSKDASPQKPKKPPQGFDHIFELTQGNLESPGFVVINGPPGAG